ncbi:MAG: HD domain-containing protein [Thermotogae bacterium]|nr:HD domain-containing protein [Thermotogota bacterium]MCP5465945.1 HD domain-containing protein [Thermotogota bacterium]
MNSTFSEKVNSGKIKNYISLFDILNETLEKLSKDFSFGAISLMLVRNTGYLFDSFTVGDEKTYKEKYLERTSLYHSEQESYSDSLILESVEIESYIKGLKERCSPYQLTLKGESYQLFDNQKYLEYLSERGLLPKNHRENYLRYYKKLIKNESFRKKYINFSDFYKKLVIPLYKKENGKIKIYGNVIISKFSIGIDPELPIPESYIKKLSDFFSDFTDTLIKITGDLNLFYGNVFKRLYSLEEILNFFEKPKYTMNHQNNTSLIYIFFLKWANSRHNLKLSHRDIFCAYIGSKFHDVGKIHIPIKILNKKGKLTPEEFEIIKKHPENGYKLFKNSGLPDISKDLIRYHHVFEDGSGYPECSKKLDKLIKIFIPIDIFEALVSERPYKSRYSFDKALEILKEMIEQGKLNRYYTEMFINFLEELRKTDISFAENKDILFTKEQKNFFNFIKSIK